VGSAAGWPPAAGGLPAPRLCGRLRAKSLGVERCARPERWPRHDDLPETATVVGSPGAPRDAAAQPSCGPSHSLSPSRGRCDAALRHGHSARGRDHRADGLTYRGDCGPDQPRGRGVRATRGSTRGPTTGRAPPDHGGHENEHQLINTVFVANVWRQAREREPDRFSAIAAVAIVAYLAHLYCRSARAAARTIVASRSRSAKAGVSAETSRAPALDDEQARRVRPLLLHRSGSLARAARPTSHRCLGRAAGALVGGPPALLGRGSERLQPTVSGRPSLVHTGRVG
jgi:hypothetical protein